jgi:hypothetical protein
MSPIFQITPDEEFEAKSVVHCNWKPSVQFAAEPLQVIPEEEELDLNLKSNAPRPRRRSPPCTGKQLSKSEHPSPSPSHWHATRRSSVSSSVSHHHHHRHHHRHTSCPPPSVHWHLAPLTSTTHVYAVGTLYPYALAYYSKASHPK